MDTTYIFADKRILRYFMAMAYTLSLAVVFLCICIGWQIYHHKKDMKIDAAYRIQIEKDINEAMAKRWGKDNWGMLPPEKSTVKKRRK